MARRGGYNSRNSYRGRRIFLTVAFIGVVGLAVWKLMPVMTDENADPGAGTELTQVNIPEAGTPVNATTPTETPVNEVPEERDVVPVQPEPAPVAVNAGAQLLAQAKAALNAQDYIAVRDKANQALKKGLSAEQTKEAIALINQVADQWLFSRNIYTNDTYCERYRVQSGDMLSTIGKKYKIPFQFLMNINGIANPSALGAGESIKVVKGPFNAIVSLSDCTLSLFLGDMLVRTYSVSPGKPGRDTPTGFWEVTLKQVNPAWPDSETGKYYYPDDPDNPLGERWIALKGLEGDAVGRKGFGIHGTIEPQKIGTPASRGCIRMINKEVEQVYDLLIEGDSKVLIKK